MDFPDLQGRPVVVDFPDLQGRPVVVDFQDLQDRLVVADFPGLQDRLVVVDLQDQVDFQDLQDRVEPPVLVDLQGRVDFQGRQDFQDQVELQGRPGRPDPQGRREAQPSNWCSSPALNTMEIWEVWVVGIVYAGSPLARRAWLEFFWRGSPVTAALLPTTIFYLFPVSPTSGRMVPRSPRTGVLSPTWTIVCR